MKLFCRIFRKIIGLPIRLLIIIFESLYGCISAGLSFIGGVIIITKGLSQQTYYVLWIIVGIALISAGLFLLPHIYIFLIKILYWIEGPVYKTIYIQENSTEKNQPTDVEYNKLLEENNKLKAERDKLNQKVVDKNTNTDFFTGTNSRESVKSRYKQLAKIYHSDNPNGDKEMISIINTQYKQEIKKYEKE